MTDNARMFPIQPQRGAAPHPTSVPWEIADLAWSVYSATYGREQTLERLAERGGFYPGEMDTFLPDWRERCDSRAELRAILECLLKDPYGCPFCDSGKLRIRVDGSYPVHRPDCPWLRAERALGRAT